MHPSSQIIIIKNYSWLCFIHISEESNLSEYWLNLLGCTYFTTKYIPVKLRDLGFFFLRSHNVFAHFVVVSRVRLFQSDLCRCRLFSGANESCDGALMRLLFSAQLHFLQLPPSLCSPVLCFLSRVCSLLHVITSHLFRKPHFLEHSNFTMFITF